MKKISYFMSMAVALLVGFSSCSNDDVLEEGGGSQATVEEGLPAVVSIRLSQATGASSRAATEESNGLAVGDETTIKNGNVFIFKADGQLEQSVVVSESDLTSGAAINVNTTTGSKFFYAVLNSKADYTKIKTLAEFKNETEAYDNLIYQSGASNNLFVITNVVEPKVTVVKESESNNVSITVGRAVAKVTLNDKVGSNNNPSGLGTITGLSYKVLNKVDKSFTAPQLDAYGYLKTPYYGENANPTYLPTLSNPFATFGVYEYTPENSSMSLFTNRATNVMVKGIFEPSTSLLYDIAGQPVSVLPSTSDDFAYLVYKKDGHILPIVFLSTTKNEVSTTPQGDKVYAYEGVSDEGLNKALAIYNSLNNTNLKDFAQTGYKAYAYVKGFTYYTTYIDDKTSVDGAGNPLYTRIQDRLSVRRNSLYNVAINSINLLGKNNSVWDNGTSQSPNPQPQDPEDTVGGGGTQTNPDEPNNPGETVDPEAPADITVTVTVSDWKAVDQNVDL